MPESAMLNFKFCIRNAALYFFKLLTNTRWKLVSYYKVFIEAVMTVI